MKKLLLAVGFLLLPVTAALAANCVPFTYTLTNGTTADANQVMSNFNTLLNCSNNNLAHNGSNSDITQLTGLTTPLTVPEGGTGLGTLTANSLMIGNGTSTPNFLTSSTTGALPFWTGTAWGAAALTAGPNISITNSSSGVTIAAAAAVLRSYLAGLTLSAAGSTGTFGIAAGEASDSTNAAMMTLASALTKTTSNWAVGTGSGGLDTGTIANLTWYAVFLIERTDTNVVDVIFTKETAGSAPSPTLPTNYTLSRYIGSMMTDSSGYWTQFVQYGDLFEWYTPIATISTTNPGTSAVLRTLTTPLGINVQAVMQVEIGNGGTGVSAHAYFSDPATADVAVSSTFTDLSRAIAETGGVTESAGRVTVMTNTSGQIRSRFDASDASVTLYIHTLGWTDTRGKLN